VTTPADGVLLIDKPSGITSHDAVALVRRTLGVRKVGHAGTLDPMATGLLLMGVGRATRLLRFLGDLPKEYEGTGVLGVETDTLDADGEVTRDDPAAAAVVTDAALRSAMASLVGEIEQTPPAYSAVKVEGERLYKAARRGEAPDVPTRTVRVDAFDLGSFATPAFTFVVRCSGGTYVRSMVRDVGVSLGCGAHLSGLRRTATGPFRVEDARPPHDPGTPLAPVAAVEHLPFVDLSDEEAVAASHGRILGPSGVPGPFRVHAPDGTLVGIYRDDGAKAVPELILAPADRPTG
jgi:tRNA pseudouridine55 synthase